MEIGYVPEISWKEERKKIELDMIWFGIASIQQVYTNILMLLN